MASSKILYAVALERWHVRDGDFTNALAKGKVFKEIVYTHADCEAQARTVVLTTLKQGDCYRVVAAAPSVGVFTDEKGKQVSIDG